MVSTYQIGTLRKRRQGLRIGAVRYLLRGVRKKDYARLDYFDVWLPTIAPSRELMIWFKKGEANKARWQSFVARYKREMHGNTDSRQTIKLLAELGKKTHISIGCYCSNENNCHRSLLQKSSFP
jgi:uncharacterized protein YeaO (DUF488 family)